jgi:hypothetical protein
MSISSFYNDDAYNTADIRTPPSSRRSSLESVEDMAFSAADTPERHRTFNDMPSISSIHEISPGFSDQSMLFPYAKMFPYQSSIGFNTFCSYDHENFGFLPSCDALPIQTPALEMDFVDPSQTTFIGAFDVHSPMHLIDPLQFESPVSDYAFDQNSPIANMPLCMRYEDGKSASTTLSQALTTSSRPPTMRELRIRQPIFEPVRSSAALQQTQAKSQVLRRTRKRGMIPSNIRIQYAPEQKCPWPRCNREFKRSEHLKRHELTVHHLKQEVFPCQFCKHLFNRKDNLKSHLKLHADPLKAKRTDFFKEAQAAIDGIDRTSKKKKTKTKVEAKVEKEMKVERESRSQITRY